MCKIEYFFPKQLQRGENSRNLVAILFNCHWYPQVLLFSSLIYLLCSASVSASASLRLLILLFLLLLLLLPLVSSCSFSNFSLLTLLLRCHYHGVNIMNGIDTVLIPCLCNIKETCCCWLIKLFERNWNAWIVLTPVGKL